MFAPADFASLELHVILLALAGGAAAESLIALWAAVSKGHWFWRALAVWAAVTALLPIRAYEPALVFAVSSPLIIAVIQSARWFAVYWPFRRGKLAASLVPALRFELGTLFLFILLCGMSLASLLYLWRHGTPVPWLHVVIPAISVAGLTCIAFLIVRGPWRVLGLLLLVAALPASTWVLWPQVKWLYKWNVLSLWHYETLGSSTSYYDGMAATALGQIELSALILMAIWAVVTPSATARPAKILLAFVRTGLAAVAIGVAVLYGHMLWLLPLAPSPIASPNHCDEIVLIAGRVKALNPTPQSLADLLAADPQSPVAVELRALYEQAERLLQANNTIVLRPEDCTEGYFSGLSMDRIQTCRHLSRALQAEGKSAIGGGNPARSAQNARTSLRLGVMLSRGGLYVDMLVGNAVLTSAASEIVRLRGQVDAATTRALIADLQRCERELEPLETIARRDVAFCQRALGWTTHLEQLVGRLVRGTMDDWSNTEAMLKVRSRTVVISQLLQADLAIRLYEHDHGEWPAGLDELVPAYLPEMPLDMPAGRQLVYRRKEPGFLLYSVGQDGRDDGGRFTNWATQYTQDGYDLDLETLTRP